VFYLVLSIKFALACILLHYLVESPKTQTLTGYFWHCALCSNAKAQRVISFHLLLLF